MKYSNDQRYALLLDEMPIPGAEFNEQPPSGDFLAEDEAIPERDPAYRLSGGTDHGEQTIEDVPAEVRLYLACRLQGLGMSPARAAAVASL